MPKSRPVIRAKHQPKAPQATPASTTGNKGGTENTRTADKRTKAASNPFLEVEPSLLKRADIHNIVRKEVAIGETPRGSSGGANGGTSPQKTAKIQEVSETQSPVVVSTGFVDNPEVPPLV